MRIKRQTKGKKRNKFKKSLNYIENFIVKSGKKIYSALNK